MGQDQKTTKADFRCPKCDFRSDNPTECPHCGVIYAKVKDPRLVAARREAQMRATKLQPETEQRFAFGGFTLALLAIPVAAVGTLLLVFMVLPVYLLEWFAVTFHEFGHALLHWLSSRAATPLAIGPSFGWTSGELDQSIWVGICFLFLIGVMGFAGIRHRTWGLVTFASALLVGQICFTFLVDDPTWEVIMIFAGIGGEFALSTLFIIGFYYRLPDRFRWDFFRYPALVFGLYAYARAAWMWFQIKAGHMRLPYGTGMFGSNDAHGDIDRLRWTHGFSEDGIIGVYLTMAIVCGLVIVGHYGFFVAREWVRKRDGMQHPSEQQP